MSDKDVATRYLLKLGSGAVAGMIGTVCIYPLDLLKTQLQVSPGSVKTQLRALLVGQNWRRLYSGLGANLIGVTPEKAIKLAANDLLREYLQGSRSELPTALGMLAGGGAGLAQFLVTNPMEVVKIRMQLNAHLSLRQTVTALGLKGLYRGWRATLLRDIPFSMFLFQSNAQCKQFLTTYTGKEELALKEVLCAGLAAGAFSAYIVTPLDVIKTRIQSVSYTTSIPLVFKQLHQESGYRGFFRGGFQRMAVISPLFGISLVVYEGQQRMFDDTSNKRV